MKILIVITKAEIGGAQVFALNLAKGLKKLGEEVVVAGGPGEFLPEALKQENIHFHRFEYLKRSLNPLNSLKFLKELKDYTKEGNFDLVHLNSTNALLGAWSLDNLKKKNNNKPKVVFTVHGLSLLDERYKGNRIIKYLYKLFFKLAFKKLDKIFFVSKNNLEFAERNNILHKNSKTELIYNGLDIDNNYYFQREEARQVLQEKLKKISRETIFNDSNFIYGSIGRLAYPKNYEFLISAHKALTEKIPNAKLVIIGEGPEREKYEAMIKAYRLENEIFLLGEMQEASKYLKAFDLFVLPSVFEGLSLSLIEASLAKIPVLASLVGGSEEIIGSLRCFKLNDLAEFIEKAVITAKREQNSPQEELEKKYDEELNNDKRFSALEMAKKYLKLYLG